MVATPALAVRCKCGYRRITALLRAEFPKHVWSYDFMENRTHNGVKFRILNVIDEFTRECLAVRMGRSLTHQTVIEVLMKLFCEQGVPVNLRSDNSPEFTANRVRAWLTSSRCLSGTYKLFRDLLPIPSDRTVPWAIVPRLQLRLVD